MEKNKSYTEKIAEEERFWGQFEEESNKFGIPWWCDLRRATKINSKICGWKGDPKAEEILRGDYKSIFIDLATANKGFALDLGCGAGWLSLELARRGISVDAYDISQERINIAKRYLHKNPFINGFGQINYHVQDLNKMEIDDDKYLSVVVWDTLHHIPEVDRLMQQVYKALKMKGVLVVYDHIGLKRCSRILIELLQIPNRICRCLKRVFAGTNRNAKCVEVGELKSPFEGVTGNEMLVAIKRYFRIIEFETQLCFMESFANELMDLPDVFKYPLLHLLKIIDDLLIKLHILSGEYIFVVAVKKERVK